MQTNNEHLDSVCFLLAILERLPALPKMSDEEHVRLEKIRAYANSKVVDGKTYVRVQIAGRWRWVHLLED